MALPAPAGIRVAISCYALCAVAVKSIDVDGHIAVCGHDNKEGAPASSPACPEAEMPLRDHIPPEGMHPEDP